MLPFIQRASRDFVFFPALEMCSSQMAVLPPQASCVRMNTSCSSGPSLGLNLYPSYLQDDHRSHITPFLLSCTVSYSTRYISDAPESNLPSPSIIGPVLLVSGSRTSSFGEELPVVSPCCNMETPHSSEDLTKWPAALTFPYFHDASHILRVKRRFHEKEITLWRSIMRR